MRRMPTEALSFLNTVGRHLRRWGLLGVLVGLVVCGSIVASRQGWFPIKRVVVRGTFSHVTKQTIEQTVAPFVREGFFDIDVHTIKAQLTALPWVAKVVVRRLWPAHVVITLSEQHPVAVWNQHSLFEANGALFTPDKKTMPQGLPVLLGPADKVHEVFEMYQQLASALLPLHMHLLRVVMEEDGSWQLLMSNGILVMLGQEAPGKSLQQFVAVYPNTVKKREKDIVSVDLRYSNGMAIRWK